MTGPVGRRVRSSIRAAVLEYFATSSMARVSPRMPAPEPPYSVGMHRPSRPASRNSSKRSCGYWPVSSISRARGWTLFWLSRRTVACSSASSSCNSKSTSRGYRRPGDPPPVEVEVLRGLPTLADDPATLTFRAAAPDAVALAVAQRVLQTCLADGALAADGLGRLGLFVGGRVEDVGIDASTGGPLPPDQVGGDHIHLNRVGGTNAALVSSPPCGTPIQEGQIPILAPDPLLRPLQSLRNSLVRLVLPVGPTPEMTVLSQNRAGLRRDL